MATEKSNKLLREELQLKKDSLKLDKEARNFSKGSFDMSIASTESIKELLGIKTRTNEFDRLILKNSKEISNQLLGQSSTLTDINSYRKDTIKNQLILQKSLALESSMLKEFSKAEQDRIKDLVTRAKARDGAIVEENKLLLQQGALQEKQAKAKAKGDFKTFDNLQKTINENEELLKSKRDFIALEDEEIALQVKGRNENGQFVKEGLRFDRERLAFFQSYNTEQLKGTQELRAETEKLVEPSSNFLSILGAIPGLSKIAAKIEGEITLEAEKQQLLGNKNVTSQGLFNKAIGKTIKNLVTVKSVGVATVLALSKAFFELDSVSVASQRNIGETYDTSRELSSEFSTVTDTLKIANSLVEQFGLNVNAAFSGETVLAASELVEAVGLTAEQAGQLAFLTEISGQNLNDSVDSAVKTINPLLSQRQILQQVGQVSSFIALNFDNQVESLIQAASRAKELGLNLDQVNKIADGLLDIESSIASEFQAEIISGKQINLERARFFALTNDLAGLTEEIANNQEIINAFETGGRIEQQAIAEALKLSADELSSMIQTQKALNNMSAEERKEKELADLKSIELQERFGKLISSLAQETVILLEPLVAGMKFIGQAVSLMLDGFKALKPIIVLAGLAAGVLGVKMLGAAISAGSIAAFLKSPMGIATGIGATLMIAGLIRRQVESAKQVGDAVIPAGKGPIISTREGGLIQGTANDDVVMAPGIARGGRNAGLSQADVAAIAKAVRDGASQAQINLDGGRVSNRLQPSLAVNTRKYST